jgi:hypothetical protein
LPSGGNCYFHSSDTTDRAHMQLPEPQKSAMMQVQNTVTPDKVTELTRSLESTAQRVPKKQLKD